VTTIPFARPGGMTAMVQADVATPAAVRQEPPRQKEHTAAPRQPASAVPSIKGLRISPPGFKATLLDISATGLLAEWGVALKIGQPVTVDFEGTFSPSSFEAFVTTSAWHSLPRSPSRTNRQGSKPVPRRMRCRPPLPIRCSWTTSTIAGSPALRKFGPPFPVGTAPIAQ
jgi:hypothetical protein